eukprot:TRINITY_DN5606_c0_g1_i1.p1 TRINITY_DN5606_c0_g1~~TRINITY_DN5606_c0_g1_i1.p1  ORF type:complete len:362 (-),score=63.11 TRINITY_DN5606_c0_g1_i1:118-1203(-)
MAALACRGGVAAARGGAATFRCPRFLGGVGSYVRGVAGAAQPERGGMTEVMYNWRVAAVHNALRDMGKETGPLAVEDLTQLGHLDQYHYLGVEANDHVIDMLGLNGSVHVLDVGSGIGGPARYISSKSGCKITCVELQTDLHDAATALTSRVPGVSERVSFLNGDFASLVASGAIPENSFDHFMSLLVFLHIPDRTGLLDACFKSVCPGATFVIEDFMQLPGKSFTDEETASLRDVVSAPTVTSAEVYVADLRKAGFVDIEVVDLSDTWRKWTKARHELYVKSRETTVRSHGEAVFDSRVRFYRTIDELFAGNLGGCKITGRKPSELEARLLAGRKRSGGKSLGSGEVHVIEGAQRKQASS